MHYCVKYNERHLIQLSERIKMKIAMDIAQGLNYMHTHDPAVIHQDIKPENIMVRIINVKTLINYISIHIGSPCDRSGIHLRPRNC